jgi:hypothetical protein
MRWNKVLREEIDNWIASNPRKAGETPRQYLARAKKSVKETVSSKYAGSPFLTILLQLLPLLLEFLFRRFDV